MTYDQILTLDFIVKYGSFKAAAKEMYKSQPSLSMAIKKLEDEFQFQILSRDNYRPQLTEEGKVFYKKAKELIKHFKELEKTAQEISAGYETEINICVDAIFPISRISTVLQQFFEPHITTTLNLTTDVLEGITQKLISHEVDFALGSDSFDQNEIEQVKIFETKMIPVISPKYQDQLSKTFLINLPQIVVSSSVKEKKNFVSGGLSKQFWYTSDFSMKEQLIESGLGWGRLPYHQIKDKLDAQKLIEIKNVTEVKAMNIPLYMLRSKSKVMGPNTKNLWKYLSTLSHNQNKDYTS
ncbi:MAG: LysR family transcriptional regulator [Bacteriovoracaceae bacterium]|jgi:DNA-binding transcriptional LysR family regulator|nr:hypothetical protein [Halobacteriovoraceae bacterium]MDP7320633.1 LysR family transcriptional regulator [Bacteriovoracaceae bacterium]